MANYFNGSHFNIESKIYHLPRTAPDTPVPRLLHVQVNPKPESRIPNPESRNPKHETRNQSIPTIGARDVKHLASPSGKHHLAFANRWGGTVAIFTWDATLHLFTPSLSIDTAGAMSLAPFTHKGEQFLAVVNVGTINAADSNHSAVYRLLPDMAGFSKLQDLPTAGASYVKLFQADGEHALLAVANVHDAALSPG